MPRPSRANANAPRASHYVGYADDDEDVTAIMAKFAAIERAEKEAASRCGGTLTEEELVRATGAHAPAANELDGGGGQRHHRHHQARPIHWFPYDRVGVVNADP